ncbi:isocitrate lyase/PEP mutase family protein [Variovorax defluvii]|uniref:Isocitrate lyase/PEP mutase family protein n=1 Tax=Variovorax defluvii TaxID=913761 RepID=A0ABP8HK87_9BURK
MASAPVIAAACYDALSARIAEVVGFDALYLSGMGVEVSQLGAPDIGLVTMSELASHAARVVDAVQLPVVADIDAGFGGSINVYRTVRTMERAGIAGLQIEDQVQPKKCPILPGRAVVSREAALDRLKAALDARRSSDLVIIARTDADVNSLQETLERCEMFREAGADVVMPMYGEFIKGLSPVEQMDFLRKMCARIRGPVMAQGSLPPPGFTADDLAAAGFRFVMFASSAVLTTVNSLAKLYRGIKESGVDDRRYKDGEFPMLLDVFKALHLDRYNAIDGG